MSFEYWYLFPVSIAVATLAMASGIGGAVFFSPIFILWLKLDPTVAVGVVVVTVLVASAGHVCGFAKEGEGALGQAMQVAMFTGISVGAINATWLAAHADRLDMNVGGLLEQWRSLELRKHLRISPMRFLWPSRGGERLGRSLIDPRALEQTRGSPTVGSVKGAVRVGSAVVRPLRWRFRRGVDFARASGREAESGGDHLVLQAQRPRLLTTASLHGVRA